MRPPAAHAWAGSADRFCRLSAAAWFGAVCDHHKQLHRRRATRTQRAAWADSRAVLGPALRTLIRGRPEAASWGLAFEYELPWEGGRRPDLVILAGGRVVVVEFKLTANVLAADVDQVAAYARDLELYHAGCRDKPVTPVLVPTRRTAAGGVRAGVRVVPPGELADLLTSLEPAGPPVDLAGWLAADYAPLPSVVAAARRVFEHEPLPDIRRAESAGVPAVLDYLDRVVGEAEAGGGRHAVLVTGVPGAGKTLVGLSFVHRHGADAASRRRAVFLSGNGPLVDVLRYALRSKVFVQPVRNFYLQHEARGPRPPGENIVVFDEAQRAWDKDRMADRYGIPAAAPEAVLRIAGRAPGWAVVVGLVGDGQEIHAGEEGGPGLWDDAVRAADRRWTVHCPPRLAGVFGGLPADRVRPAGGLDLTVSLRSHRAGDVQAWVGHLLAGELADARRVVPRVRAAGFAAYLTRDLDAVRGYCRARYAGEPDKTFGLVASSRARLLPKYGVPNDYPSTQRVAVGPWYVDPADSPRSCRALREVVTEFGCQGLELDFPVVCWGDDLLWDGARWEAHTRQKGVKDPRRLRVNSYRVLLTRGRDGFAAFVPPDPRLDRTAAALAEAGLGPLG